MVTNKHYAAQEIQNKLDSLQRELQELKDLAAERKGQLQDSLRVQQVNIDLAWSMNHAKEWNIDRTWQK